MRRTIPALLTLALLAPAPAPAPCDGLVQPRPLPSFWCVDPGARIRVVGGQWGLNPGVDGGATVLWAQGAYASVEVDGVTLAGAHRVALPLVGR